MYMYIFEASRKLAVCVVQLESSVKIVAFSVFMHEEG